MISASQIRAARALLDLSAEDLAGMAEISWATIQRFEDADGVPRSRGGTLERVKYALEQAGIEFFGDPVTTPGVRLKRK